MASQTIKRQRKRKRLDMDGDPEFQVAPMVDVLLVLLLFFMAITSTEVLKKNPNLTLAEAKHGKKPEDTKNQIVINISWDGTTSVAHFSMDERDYAAATDLTGVLAARMQQNKNAYVLIRSDKDVEYSNVADLMTACANAGIGTVTFAVISGGGNAPAGAAKP